MENYGVSMFKFILGMSNYQMRGTPVYFWSAAEPEDVKWENLGFSFRQRTLRVIGNWIITIAILCICLVANIYISAANVSHSFIHPLLGTLLQRSRKQNDPHRPQHCLHVHHLHDPGHSLLRHSSYHQVLCLILYSPVIVSNVSAPALCTKCPSPSNCPSYYRFRANLFRHCS